MRPTAMQTTAATLASLCVIACVDERPSEAPPTAPIAPPLNEPKTVGPASGAETADESDTADTGSTEVRLYAGFNPDPRIVSGSARGEIPARSIHKRCSGWVSSRPNHLVVADTAFLKLYVFARSSERVSIVVEKPNGRVVCEDGKKGRGDPMLYSNIPIGTSKVWVGVAAEGAAAQYNLGFSEVTWQSTAIPTPGGN